MQQCCRNTRLSVHRRRSCTITADHASVLTSPHRGCRPGTLGGTNATPLVNPPEAAIVALGRVRPMPRYHPVTGELVKQHVMAISWGADHRVVDGATIAEFSNCWKALLEEPQRLMLHMR